MKKGKAQKEKMAGEKDSTASFLRCIVEYKRILRAPILLCQS